MRCFPWMMLFLAACIGTPKESETGTTLPDQDGDGYIGESDCDDTNADIHIHADEICDGLDNNCDGLTDDATAQGATLWYLDGDADGYGGIATVTACTAPPSYVEKNGDCNDSDTMYHPGAAESDCTDGNDYNCDGTVQFADGDGDGYAACKDCDDTNAAIRPDAAEICNQTDDNCDGIIDNDPVDGLNWYEDADQDGYGNVDVTVSRCVAPPGYVGDNSDCKDSSDRYHPGAEETNCADPQDYNCDGSVGAVDADADGYYACEECDDANPDAFPGAAESCNGLDDDCNGQIDDGSGTPSTWYRDADKDNYGDESQVVSACSAPLGFVAGAGDCNDADSAFHPGATENDCANPNDYNCDGSVGTADVDTDGYPACADCNDASAEAFPGGTERCDRLDNDCDGQTDESSAIDAHTWFPDRDQDGYGSGAGLVACDAPANYAPNEMDCDDYRASAYPGASESCNGQDDDCDGTTDEDAVDALAWFRDEDGDGFGTPAVIAYACDLPTGYAANGDDCHDGDRSIYPGATEFCDGEDNDCDGVVDNVFSGDATWWYADADGDGYGEATASVQSCTRPAGYAADSGDCDETNPDIHPQAEERCDGIDNNCDGQSDGNDAVDQPTWYPDRDGDGYGDPGVGRIQCNAPIGDVSNNYDCDDRAVDVHPGANEICDPSDVDEDCNGVADDQDPQAIGATVWFADKDGDTYGNGREPTRTACDAPSGYAATDGDCNDGNGNINPGAAEVCDVQRVDEDCDGLINDADPNVDASSALNWYSDADGDGYGDNATIVTACSRPSNLVEWGDDCNDGEAAINPGATEVCDPNDVDENCDGAADDLDPTVYPGTQNTFFEDTDGDGYGNGSSSLAACDLPFGYVTSDGDCDDTEATAHPGGQEVCDPNRVDEDCDGLVNDSDPSEDRSTKLTWYRDDDQDLYGDATRSRNACEQPAGYVGTKGDCDDTNADIRPGATEVCDGASVDEDCDGLVNDADPGVDPSTFSPFYADVDGDGYGDTSASVGACIAPSGYVNDATDCNDGSITVHPGATEVCDPSSTDEDCNGLADDQDPGVDPASLLSWYPDVDGDNYGDEASPQFACIAPSGTIAQGGDCDDRTSAVSPAGTEVCDPLNLDEDCSGTADDGDPNVDPFTLVTWYADTDGDAYGDPTHFLDRCDAPSGYITNHTDCDDTDPATHPGRLEVCDPSDQDEDCNGLADDQDPQVDISSYSTFFLDNDADNYGSAATSVDQCDAPAAYVTDGNDCDDTAASVNPGMTEICGVEGVDEDCDTLVDDNDPSLDLSTRTTWHLDQDIDNYGSPTNTFLSCTQPSGYLLDGTDCDDSTSAVSPGATEICENGINDDCSSVDTCTWASYHFDLEADDSWLGATAATMASATGTLGNALTGGKDLNGDGLPDLVIADRLWDASDALANRGRVYLLSGAIGGITDSVTSPTATVSSTTNNDRLGQSVGMLSDPDGDGDDELLVGAYLAGTTDSGAAYLFEGPLNGAVTTASAAVTVTGTGATEYVGWAVADVGDLTQDGVADWAVSAYFHGTTGSRGGRVALVSGALANGSYSITSATALINGASNDRFGASLASDIDVDGDGQTDLVVGALGTSTVHIFHGPLSGVLSSASADATLTGLSWLATGTSEANIGTPLANAGDLDNDGYEDLLVGSDGTDVGTVVDAGAAYVFAGPVASSGISGATATLLGVTAADHGGRAVAAAGDTNADGFDDLLIGAPGFDTLYTNDGAAMLAYGPLSGTVGISETVGAAFVGIGSANNFGAAVAGVGSVDGDAYDDFLFGATGMSNGSLKVGAAYLFLGTGE